MIFSNFQGDRTCAEDQTIRVELGAGQSHRSAWVGDLGDEAARPEMIVKCETMTRTNLRSENAQCWSVEVVRT